MHFGNIGTRCIEGASVLHESDLPISSFPVKQKAKVDSTAEHLNKVSERRSGILPIVR